MERTKTKKFKYTSKRVKIISEMKLNKDQRRKIIKEVEDGTERNPFSSYETARNIVHSLNVAGCEVHFSTFRNQKSVVKIYN